MAQQGQTWLLAPECRCTTGIASREAVQATNMSCIGGVLWINAGLNFTAVHEVRLTVLFNSRRPATAQNSGGIVICSKIACQRLQHA